MNIPKVFIASDHAGYELKEAIKRLLPDFIWEDLGPKEANRVDYPDYAVAVCKKVLTSPGTAGVLICGSGVGMAITANKINGIRAVNLENPVVARLAREHNDANIICLGARFLAAEYASEITRIFLSTPFSDDARHQARIKKITEIENKK